MPESVSPRTTVYIRAVPARDCGVLCARTSSRDVFDAFGALAVDPPDVLDEDPAGFADVPFGWTSGVSPPLLSPARPEHTGHAPGPCPSSTFSATAICWSRVARSARGAYRAPPYASQVDWVNCSPP